MKNQGVKQLIICDLVSKGFDFNCSPFELSTQQSLQLATIAKTMKYRRPKNSYFSLGRAFFAHL